MFFQVLHHIYAQSNVAYMKEGGDFIVDSTIVIAICVNYFKDLLGSHLFMTNEVIRATIGFIM